MRRLRWGAIYLLCAATVLFVRGALWVTRYQNIRGWLVRRCAPAPQPERIATVIRIARAVEKTARFIPDASCLTQTISCQAILSWKDIPSTISMGVLKEKDGTIRMHAWLVWNGQTVLDGENLKGFSKILDLPTPSSDVPLS